MSEHHQILPDLPMFVCKRCGKHPRFIYRFKDKPAKMSKICERCVIKALDRLGLEVDLAEEISQR